MSNKNKLLTGFLVLLVCGQAVAPAIFSNQIYHITSALQLQNYYTTELAMISVVTVTDTILAVALAGLLYKRRTGFAKSDTILRRLAIYSIGTGLITGLWCTIGLIGLVSLVAHGDEVRLFLPSSLGPATTRLCLLNDILCNPQT